MQKYFEYTQEVKQALQNGLPILALESTLITHGLPYPHNLNIALECEKIARAIGVTPATIAIMHGKIKIGLSQDDLNELITDKHSIKVSRRDLAYALNQKLNAGTTVAATLFAAHHAGIKLFATGGIGGVHRGEDWDISADLIELSRIPTAVICSGAKSILDLPKTLELLETLSIPLLGFQTKQLPAFYSHATELSVPASIESVEELAAILQTHWDLNPQMGALITNPIPKESEIPHASLEPVIQIALQKADEHKIRGKHITPFLLNEIVHATEGSSLAANMELIKHNVRLGAALANCFYHSLPDKHPLYAAVKR